jgi:hypothetical protein
VQGLSIKGDRNGTSYQPSVADQFDWATKYYWKVQAYRTSTGLTKDSTKHGRLPSKMTFAAEQSCYYCAPMMRDIPRSQQLQWKTVQTAIPQPVMTFIWHKFAGCNQC